MDTGALQATVHGVAESDTAEQATKFDWAEEEEGRDPGQGRGRKGRGGGVWYNWGMPTAGGTFASWLSLGDRGLRRGGARWSRGQGAV